jgi:hypothetical protein
MDALVEYLAGLRDLRRDMPGDIPRFSDKDGRTKAKVLFLFEDPGKSGAAESGEVDRDNDDPSAKAFTEANKGVLNRETTVSWNTIPWARQEKVAQEISLVREWKLVPKLLDALPDVRVVVPRSGRRGRGCGPAPPPRNPPPAPGREGHRPPRGRTPRRAAANRRAQP